MVVTDRLRTCSLSWTVTSLGMGWFEGLKSYTVLGVGSNILRGKGRHRYRYARESRGRGRGKGQVKELH